jgi:Ni/Co efflux regulator RcnB
MRASPFSLLAIVAASMLAAAPVLATDHGEDHGKGHGNGHGKGHDKAEKHEVERHGHREIAPGAYFDDRHRTVVRTYYAEPRHCPPGLAKKHNGCMPPGQAKKWHVGQPLPRTVVYAPVPQPVLVQLPPVPTGYRYVNVSGDILLVALGSMMVVDGINGLMR